MTQEYVIQRKGAVISEGENSFVPEEGLRAAEYRLIGNTPDAKASEVPNKEEFEIIQHQNKDQVDDYIKVKKVEYDMLGVIAIEGIKLLKQEIDKLNNRIKELENGRDSDVEHD